ncbi:hypothetical protein DXG03_007665, partial [Asterophora parasitica]
SESFNFSKSGEGAYHLEANNLFYIVDKENKAVPIYAKAEAHRTKLTGKLAVVRPAELKRATFNGCSSTQQSQLNTAASSAQTYAANALS